MRLKFWNRLYGIFFLNLYCVILCEYEYLPATMVVVGGLLSAIINLGPGHHKPFLVILVKQVG